MDPRPGFSLAGLVARLRSLWRGWRRRDDIEADMAEEFRHHVELRTEHLIRQGVPPTEAARRARLEFGHVESHRKDARAARGLHVLDQIGFSWLDVKLGARMFVKHPGLSLVAVSGMSVAIALGAAGFGLIHAVVDADLPFEEGDRIVVLQNSDPRVPGAVTRRATHDFLLWRDELTSVADLSAFRTEQATVHVAGEAPVVASVASMTASGFDVPRIAPLLGRSLLPEDERPGAPPVAVIAYDEWRYRFAGDPDVLGRTVRLGATEHTVVGVMPEGFRFPVNERYWLPLRLDPTSWEVGAGPEITVFGRLADDVTIARAREDLSVLGTRMAAASPATHGHLRPTVLPYTDSFVGIDGAERAWTVRSIEIVLSLLLVVVAVNVSVLVYARTVARMGEITVRTALGASRRRILTQLFAEALVLSGVAAALGLGMAALGFDRLLGVMSQGGADGLPFWVEIGLSPALAAYTVALAVLAAVIVGVLPGLKATGRSVQGRLQELYAGGLRMKLGRTWTALIVGQVAIAVAVLPYALYVVTPSVTRGFAEADYPAGAFLRASISLDDEASDAANAPGAAEAPEADAERARFLEGAAELVRRLEQNPRIAGVAFASRFPGAEEVGRIEVEGSAERASVWLNEIDTDLFSVFDVPILAGRGFTIADAGARAAVVDEVFVDEVLGGGQALGRRVRVLGGPAPEGGSSAPAQDAGSAAPERGSGAAAPDGESYAATAERGSGRPAAEGGSGEPSAEWLEIVGVVPAFTVPPAFQPQAPKLYRPLALADISPGVQLAIRTRPDAPPASYMARLREMADAVDPDLRLVEVEPAALTEAKRRQGLLFIALVVMAVTGSTLLLSAAGIYAMMSFTVASRRREIGIRAALGAAPARVLGGVFRRASIQIGAGVLAGLLIAEGILRASGGTFLRGEGAHLFPTVAALMGTIGLLAALGPARRGLAVQPTEALREE